MRGESKDDTLYQVGRCPKCKGKKRIKLFCVSSSSVNRMTMAWSLGETDIKRFGISWPRTPD